MGLFIAAFIATLITAAIFLIFCIHLMNGKKFLRLLSNWVTVADGVIMTP